MYIRVYMNIWLYRYNYWNTTTWKEIVLTKHPITLRSDKDENSFPAVDLQQLSPFSWNRVFPER